MHLLEKSTTLSHHYHPFSIKTGRTNQANILSVLLCKGESIDVVVTEGLCGKYLPTTKANEGKWIGLEIFSRPRLL